MKRRIQKSLCLLLALIMVLSIVPVASVSAAPAGDRLDGWNETIYDFLKTNISAVASGTQASTEFSTTNIDDSLKWTKAELGVSAIISNGSITEAAMAALGEKFAEVVNLDDIMHSLLADFPYELYWYDKTTGVEMGYRVSANTSEIRITELIFKLAVCDEYATSQYTVNTYLTRAMSAVTDTALSIVEKHAGKSDWDKLTAYKDEICDLVTYNHSAADNPNTPYGNPWQLINVFDNDTSTNVVCEGYAKAFKLLCDLTDFQDDVYCYTVTGYMQGATGAGDHMWNVVEISGGRLMVDVTNCDEGSIGAPDQLFLVSGTKTGNSYAFSAGSSTIYYTYDPDEYDLYTDGYLELYPIPEQHTDPAYLSYKIVDGEAIITRCDRFFESKIYTIPSTLSGYKVTTIGKSAFSNCEYIYEFIIPEGVTSIEEGAFWYCYTCKSITIPRSVTRIGDDAFIGCDALTHVYYNGSASEWAQIDIGSGNDALYSANIHCAVPDYLTYEIDDNGAIITRCDTSIEGTLVIPSVLGGYPVASIRFSAFYGCEGLTEIILPETLKYIGNSAFYGCTGLTEITIPASVTEIGSNPFGNCTNLQSINVANGNTCYSSYDDALYNADQTELLCVPAGFSGTFTVPSSVTYIAYSAFFGCTDLFKVNIGANATYISPYAFDGCSTLHSIWVDHNNATYANDEYGILYNNDKTAIVYVPMGVTGDVTLPTTLLAIEEQAFAHRQKLTAITILHETTTIANAAFFNCTNLMDVTLGAGVTDLHWNAFELCTSLQGIWVNTYNPNFSSYQGVLFNKNQTVLITAPKNLAGSYTIPAGVLTVADNAFNGCEQLTEISGGKDVTTIGNAAFKNCIRLKNIFLGNSAIETIREKAFYNCYALEKLSVPVSLSKISDGAFDRCSSLRDVYYGATLTQWEAIDIGGNNDAFNTVTIHTEEAPEYLVYEIVDGQAIVTDCSEDVFDVIRIPSKLGGYPVTAIADYALANCMNVYEIYIPEGVTTIGNHAFDYSWRLDMISLPSTLTSIGTDVAKNCSYLNTIYFAGTRDQWEQISIAESNENFNAASVKFTSDPWWYLTFEVKDDEVIVTDCDEYYEGEIVIPQSMYGLPITTIGDRAFENCESITSVTLSGNVQTIGDYAFSFCRAMEYINIEGLVLEIGEGAFFDCQSLTSFDIPEYITTIEPETFAFCAGLTSIEIPIGVKTIGNSAFSCTGLTEITIPNSVTGIGDYAFHGCYNLQTVTLSSKLETIGEYAFNECVALTGITIPSSVTDIGKEAFNGCSSLTALYIDNATTPIGYNAFMGCANLGYIYFGNNVTAIDDGAFGLCTSLTQVTIPESVKTIGQGAFASCTGLQEVYFYNTLEEIGYGAFDGCESLQQITIPGSVKIISSAFSNCTSLTSVTLLPGCEQLGYGAFNSCTNLQQITIPTTVTKIYASAFMGCPNYMNIYYGGSQKQWNEINFVSTNEALETAYVIFAVNCDNGHYWDDGEITIYPSCTNPGEILYRCTLCEDAFYTDSIDQQSHNNEAIVTKATLSSDGNITTQCSSCGGVESITFIPRVDAFSHPDHFFIWDGSVKTPTPIVWDREGNALTEGVDYTLSYPGNSSNVGTYEMVITFKGNYSGTKVLTFEILPALSITSQPSTAKVKVGATAKFTVKAEGFGLDYQWQSSTDGMTWKDCSSSSATKASFSFTTKTSHNGNYYRCKITDYNGNTVYTNAVRVYVLGVTTQPKTATVKSGSTIKYTVKATGTGVKYQWQTSTDGKTWKNCSSSSATTASFSFTSKTSHNGYYYRCKVTDSAGNVVYTDAVRAYVLGVSTQPKTATVKSGATIKYTVKATGNGLKYQWQTSTDGKTWKNCSSSSATKATFSFTSKTSHNGYYYRCKVTDSAGNVVYTDAVRAYVLGVTTQPKTQKVKAGATIKLTVKATGTGLKYQWQYSTNGKTWKDCSASAAKKASYSFTSKTSNNGYYYRCKVTDSAGNVVYTDTIRTYVLGITEQPVKKSVAKGKTAKFEVEATGHSVTYQWQYSTDGGKTWKTCSGTAAKKAAYSFTTKASQNGYYYRCKVTDSAGNVVYSSKVKLTVK